MSEHLVVKNYNIEIKNNNQPFPFDLLKKNLL
jgi:hypothetical protein